METTIKRSTKFNKRLSFTNVMVGILIVYLYYMGFNKLLWFNSFHFWLKNAPPIPQVNVLVYLVPALQLTLAGMLFSIKTRSIALIIMILEHLIYFFWIVYLFYGTPYLIWPWQAFGNNWFYKLLEILTASWTAIWCLRLSLKVNKI